MIDVIAFMTVKHNNHLWTFSIRALYLLNLNKTNRYKIFIRVSSCSHIPHTGALTSSTKHVVKLFPLRRLCTTWLISHACLSITHLKFFIANVVSPFPWMAFYQSIYDKYRTFSTFSPIHSPLPIHLQHPLNDVLCTCNTGANCVENVVLHRINLHQIWPTMQRIVWN